MPSRRTVVVEALPGTDLGEFPPLLKPSEPDQTCHLILGLDAVKFEGQTRGLGEWLDHFWEIYREGVDPHEFAATVFLLNPPEGNPKRLGDEEVDRLVEAGSCPREKTEEYEEDGVDLATALRNDLFRAGVISAEEIEELEEAQESPAPRMTKEEFGTLIGYYADPPLTWPEGAIRELLGDPRPDTTTRLPH